MLFILLLGIFSFVLDTRRNYMDILQFCQGLILICHLKLKSGLFAIESWTCFQLKAGLL